MARASNTEGKERASAAKTGNAFETNITLISRLPGPRRGRAGAHLGNGLVGLFAQLCGVNEAVERSRNRCPAAKYTTFGRHADNRQRAMLSQ